MILERNRSSLLASTTAIPLIDDATLPHATMVPTDPPATVADHPSPVSSSGTSGVAPPPSGNYTAAAAAAAAISSTNSSDVDMLLSGGGSTVRVGVPPLPSPSHLSRPSEEIPYGRWAGGRGLGMVNLHRHHPTPPLDGVVGGSVSNLGATGSWQAGSRGMPQEGGAAGGGRREREGEGEEGGEVRRGPDIYRHEVCVVRAQGSGCVGVWVGAAFSFISWLVYRWPWVLERIEHGAVAAWR